MPKPAAFAASLAALLVCFAGDPGFAQVPASAEAPAARSRLLPYSAPNSPPPVITIGPAAPTGKPAKPNNVLPIPARTSDIVAAAERCREVVSPRFEVNTTALAEAGWGHTQPERASNANGSFETIQYLKDDMSIALLDYGNLVICRAIATISGQDQFDEVRAKLIAKLKAVPLDQAQGMDAYRERIVRGTRQAVHPNFMIVGNYSMEISLKTIDLAKLNVSDGSIANVVMIESVPLPAQFQTAQKSQ